MKEFSIEEKAKAYDEALERAKKWFNEEEPDSYTCIVESIFPELQKNEDEEPQKNKDKRIRKALIDTIKSWGAAMESPYMLGISEKDCLAWLKKQNEPIEINPSEFDLRLNRLLKQFETLSKEELKSSLSFYLNVIQNDGTYKNKKPKFEAGSWITNGEFVWLISNVGDFDYEVISPKGECVTDTISHVDEYFHLWTLEDAKDGDVLTANIHHWEIGGNIENLPVRVPTIFIYRETKTDDKNVHACVSLFDNTTLNIYKSMYYIDDFGIKNIHPATKEQQKLLFLTMQEAGYEWDANEKLPKKIEQNKVESKFHEGDWTVSNLDGKARQISEVHSDEYNSYYVVNGKSVNLEEYDRLHHSWTIADVKDGDILKEDSCIFIIKKMNPNGTAIVHCCLFDDGDLVLTGSTLNFDTNSTYPATEEERITIFTKMQEAGYKWDNEKKEPKKIEQNNTDEYIEVKGLSEIEAEADELIKEISGEKHNLTDFERTLADICIGWIGEEPGWKEYIKDNADVLLKIAVKKFNSVQDVPFEQMPNPYSGTSFEYNGHTWGMCARDYGVDILCDKHLIGHLGNEQILVNSAKTCKDAWSEEDEKMFIIALNMVEWYGGGYEEKVRNVSDWLKSLKDRVQPERVWSEEDENMLEKTIKLLNEFGGDRNAGAYTLQEMSCRNCADWLKSLK